MQYTEMAKFKLRENKNRYNIFVGLKHRAIRWTLKYFSRKQTQKCIRPQTNS